jgi:hypothetical protein
MKMKAREKDVAAWLEILSRYMPGETEKALNILMSIFHVYFDIHVMPTG